MDFLQGKERGLPVSGKLFLLTKRPLATWSDGGPSGMLLSLRAGSFGGTPGVGPFHILRAPARDGSLRMEESQRSLLMD